MGASIFFWLFGVKAFSARLLVSLSVGISLLLLYKLVSATTSSQIIAAATTLTFFSMRLSSWVANDVMLEFPSLVFVLASLFVLKDIDQDWSVPRGLAFAILAGAAVWTKQHAVFLGAVPFFYIAFSGQWQLLKSKALWISTATFALLVLGLLALSWPFQGAGALKGLVFSLTEVKWYHFSIPGWKSIPIVLGIAFFTVDSLFLKKKFTLAIHKLYFAWGAAALLVLAITWQKDLRYLFYFYPALIAASYMVVARFLVLFDIRLRITRYLPMVIAFFFAATNLNAEHSHITGPELVARDLAKLRPARVLYGGLTDGHFVFAMRCEAGTDGTIILRADKIADSTFVSHNFELFAHRFGIEYIVFERTSEQTAWKDLVATPSPSMVLQAIIPLKSSQRRFNGKLYVYRFSNPAPNPESVLSIKINPDYHQKGFNFLLRLNQ